MTLADSNQAQGLGFLETPFLSVTALSVDAALKAAPVRLLGLEPIGTEFILSRFAGDPGSLEAALSAGKSRALELGASDAKFSLLASPSKDLHTACQGNHSINPLYGGREYFLPNESGEPTSTSMNSQAIGILETQGLTAILRATDSMLKAANVELVTKEKIGAAYVTIIVRGDVAAVTAAVEAGKEAVGDLGKLIAAEVISRPHSDLQKLL